MASVEVPYDMREDGVMAVRIFLTTAFKCYGNAFLGLKIHPFPDGKSSCTCYFRVAFLCIDFIPNLSLFRTPMFSSFGGGVATSLPPSYTTDNNPY